MKGIILDSNLLILLAVGTVGRSYVGVHKRTREFSREDFDLLTATLAGYETVILCPNTATEAFNMLMDDGRDPRFGLALAGILNLFSETYVESVQAIGRPEFSYVGLTDAALVILAEQGYPLLTNDDLLHEAALRASASALHFDYLRNGAYG